MSKPIEVQVISPDETPVYLRIRYRAYTDKGLTRLCDEIQSWLIDLDGKIEGVKMTGIIRHPYA